jgi:hypothetical protein
MGLDLNKLYSFMDDVFLCPYCWCILEFCYDSKGRLFLACVQPDCRCYGRDVLSCLDLQVLQVWVRSRILRSLERNKAIFKKKGKISC